MFVDAHLHLNEYEDTDRVVSDAEKERVNLLITDGYDLLSSQKAVEYAKKYKNVYATVGVHPEKLDGLEDAYIEKITELAKHDKVVAIGEIGLDYHFRVDNKELQKRVFAEQLELANKLNLPVVIHSRDAMMDTYEILKSHPLKRRSLLHCYGGSFEMAKEFMKLGFSFSFGGVCTFKNARVAVENIQNLPLESILTETDSPYMAPEPFRGTKNEPKNIPIIAKKIAEIKQISVEEVEKQIYQNTKELFNI